jgi:diguanylate cyclase (GGDEF)-like protein
MLTVYNCIVEQHDVHLVLLAAIICAISALTAVSLLDHVKRATGLLHLAWTALTAASIGFGIWATHFIAMLAFSPSLPAAYDVPLTLVSLGAAILITGIGTYVATMGDTIDHHLVGGTVIGGGIAAMHFIGMAAFQVEGVLVWDQRYVAVSLVAAVIFGACAIRAALALTGRWSRSVAALVLTLAICSLHFTAMAAVTIQPDMSVAIAPSSVPAAWLAVAVAVAALLILLFSAVVLWVDVRGLRRAEAERKHLLDLANAAIEGLVVCRAGMVVTANASFLTLSGLDLSDVVDAQFDRLIVRHAADPAGEAVLQRADGTRLPVEVLARAMNYNGVPHTVYAVRDLRERKKAEADIRHLALHDTLTDLPNRRAFKERLDREIEAHSGSGDRHLALLCLDLDRFKEINDLFGHAAGDAMLQRVARSVAGVLTRDQMFARLGGDEFAIIAPGIKDRQEARHLANAILEAFRLENRNAASDGVISTSIGIALCPSDATDAGTLVGQADTALYRAKADGRDTYRFYETQMGQEVHMRRLMEHDLRHAVSRKELSLVYQPQKKLDTGETIGFEALLRWHHPRHGSISPTVFIPVAEESGAITAIGDWVLETACKDAASWNDRLTVAVNVSAVQLRNPEFARKVHRVLLRTGLPPPRLEIEITETALGRDMNRTLATLRQLKALGVTVAMDDFGTGHSSLSTLRAFPFDRIKIDASFVRSVDTNEQAAAIVRAVLGIGRGLGLPVLAEGVETKEELEFLSGEFCQIGQGYLLGRPAPLSSFKDIEERTSSAA